jgi:ArsR family transcriptional regulator
MKTMARLPIAQLAADAGHVEAFKALAHLSRLQVFFFLVKAGREISVGEIQEAVEIPGPTLSHHLDVLRRAGLVQSRKQERYIY